MLLPRQGGRHEGKLTDRQADHQAQNQDYKVAHPNIHLNYVLLERVKGLFLQIQSNQISVTEGNNRSHSEGPGLMGLPEP